MGDATRLVLAILLLHFSIPVGAASSSLRFWLVFNERKAPADNQLLPIEEFLDLWKRQGVDLSPLKDRAATGREFYDLLRGQRQLLASLADFRKRQPSFPTIEIRFFGWDEYYNSIHNARREDLPHLLQVPSTWCSSLAAHLKILSPLPSRYESGFRQNYDLNLMQPCLVNGQPPLYGVPWIVDARVFYFWREDLSTFPDELRSTSSGADALTRALRETSRKRMGYPAFALPTARDWELLHQTTLLVWGFGGDMIRRGFLSSLSPAFQEPALRGSKFIRDLHAEGLLSLPRESRDEIERRFTEHRLGSVISGPWLLWRLSERLGPSWDKHVGVSLPPLFKTDVRPTTFLGGSVLSITASDSRNKELATSLASYLSGEAGLSYALAVGTLPAQKSAIGQQPVNGNRASPCTTYFDCVAAASTSTEAAAVFASALKNGRSYPAIPQWQSLEDASRLGPLYYLWQDISAQQDDQTLARQINALAADWDSTLTRVDPRFIVASIALTLSLGVYYLWSFRYRRKLAFRARNLVSSITALERLLPGQQTLDNSVMAVRLNLEQQLENARIRIESLNNPIQAVLARITQPVPADQRFYEFELPRNNERLKYRWDGSQEWKVVEGNPGVVLEVLLRQCLLEQRTSANPVCFSIALGALHCWPSGTLPRNPGAAWSVLVSNLRDPFEPGGQKVVPTAKGGVYTFRLSPRKFACYIPAPDGGSQRQSFNDAVTERYWRARSADENANALSEAVAAFEAIIPLHYRDPDLTILICSLSRQAPAEVIGTFSNVLDAAKRELSRLYSDYQAFFERYHDAETFLRAIHLTPRNVGDAFHQDWHTHVERWGAIRGLAQSIDPDPTVPPAGMREAWQRAVLLASGDGDKTDEVRDAIIEILEFWRSSPHAHVFAEVKQLFFTYLDPGMGSKNRIESFIGSCCYSIVETAVKARGPATPEAFARSFEDFVLDDTKRWLQAIADSNECSMQNENAFIEQARRRCPMFNSRVKSMPKPDLIFASTIEQTTKLVGEISRLES